MPIMRAKHPSIAQRRRGSTVSVLGLLVTAGLMLSACGPVSDDGVQARSNRTTGTLTHAGIQDEVTIDGHVTISGGAGD